MVLSSGGTPGDGGVKEVTNVRSAVVGIDVSMECVVLMLETRSMKGGRMSAGNLSTKAPTLMVKLAGLIRRIWGGTDHLIA